jgi:hypothetical protein
MSGGMAAIDVHAVTGGDVHRKALWAARPYNPKKCPLC